MVGSCTNIAMKRMAEAARHAGMLSRLLFERKAFSLVIHLRYFTFRDIILFYLTIIHSLISNILKRWMKEEAVNITTLRLVRLGNWDISFRDLMTSINTSPLTGGLHYVREKSLSLKRTVTLHNVSHFVWMLRCISTQLLSIQISLFFCWSHVLYRLYISLC